MIKEFQVKGLEKLVNSAGIKDIYPMVDHIKIHHEDDIMEINMLKEDGEDLKLIYL